MILGSLLQEQTLKKLNNIQQILGEYHSQGLLPITIRQLYYEMVARIIIGNNTNEYTRMKKLMTVARETGEIPYEYIIDTTRRVSIPAYYHNVEDCLKDTVSSYRLNRWADQDYYIEVWVEKDAMASTISDIPWKYSIPFMSNKGYSSTTAMHDAEERFDTNEYKCKILYLGDHDPSGLNMDKDISNRVGVEVERIALTVEQVEKYSLPPNPAKKSDPRSKNYVSEYGNKSWELEALPIKLVRELLEEKIMHYIDMNKYNKVRELEEVDKEKIRELF